MKRPISQIKEVEPKGKEQDLRFKDTIEKKATKWCTEGDKHRKSKKIKMTSNFGLALSPLGDVKEGHPPPSVGYTDPYVDKSDVYFHDNNDLRKMFTS